MMKPSRNAPCPCGSGKKYKRCCGASSQPVTFRTRKDPDYVALNQAIAYKGKIGRMREDFCRNFIETKRTIIQKIEQDLVDQVKTKAETITCHKGCFYCCSQHVTATLQESEVIVYYLYQHPEVLTAFLQSYTRWRAQVRENQPLFDRMKLLGNEAIESKMQKDKQVAFMEASMQYLTFDIHCPFLRNGICSIYEVRPWACASVVATTPGEWCSASNNNKPNVYLSRVMPTIDRLFYIELGALIILPVPLAVYEILHGGFIWLSDIPGLKGLDDNAMSDPEVKVILQRYL